MGRPALDPTGRQTRRTLMASPGTWQAFDALRASLGITEAELLRRLVLAPSILPETPCEP